MGIREKIWICSNTQKPFYQKDVLTCFDVVILEILRSRYCSLPEGYTAEEKEVSYVIVKSLQMNFLVMLHILRIRNKFRFQVFASSRIGDVPGAGRWQNPLDGSYYTFDLEMLSDGRWFSGVRDVVGNAPVWFRSISANTWDGGGAMREFSTAVLVRRIMYRNRKHTFMNLVTCLQVWAMNMLRERTLDFYFTDVERWGNWILPPWSNFQNKWKPMLPKEPWYQLHQTLGKND